LYLCIVLCVASSATLRLNVLYSTPPNCTELELISVTLLSVLLQLNFRTGPETGGPPPRHLIILVLMMTTPVSSVPISR
ncbi:hypothetical protein EDD17DRAFT_1521945, partial [Pisolithus thermaeus]